MYIHCVNCCFAGAGKQYALESFLSIVIAAFMSHCILCSKQFVYIVEQGTVGG